MEIVPIQRETEERISSLFADQKEIIDTGEVESMAFAIVRRDGTIDTGWSSGRAGALLGSIARLSHRVNVHMDNEG